MLGFDVIGRLALGELSAGAQNIVLSADSGSYTVIGNAAGGRLSQSSQSGSYLVVGNPANFGVAGESGSGVYSLTGNAIAFGSSFVADSGAYAVVGQPLSFAPILAAAPGYYEVQGVEAGQRFKADSGSYLIANAKRVFDFDGCGLLGFGAIGGSPLAYDGLPIFSDPVVFAINFVAAGGTYTLTLGDYELRRTGYDYDPVQYGIGHIKLAMEEARRRSRVIKTTPYPVVRQLPRLPVPQAVPPKVAPVQGLIDDSEMIDRLVAAEQAQAARQQEAKRMRARNRAVTALLLAA